MSRTPTKATRSTLKQAAKQLSKPVAKPVASSVTSKSPRAARASRSAQAQLKVQREVQREAQREDEPMSQVTLKLRQSQHRELAQMAFDAGTTMRGIIMQALKSKGLSITKDDLKDRRRR